MDGRKLVDWFEFTLGPSGWAVLLVTLIVVSIPILLHLFWFNAASSTSLPSFLLIGPSGSGKTSLMTLLERGSPATTHTSQRPLAVECSLPVTTEVASSKYRSANDPGAKYHRTFLLVDTPGHGKLRHYALDSIINPQHLKGIIFVVDAATLSSTSSEAEGSTLPEAAAYLYDVLLMLQKKATSGKSGKKSEMPILIAANKLDLFTALPSKMVKSALELEINKIKASKSTGLMDSGVDMDQVEDREVLGGGGEGKFDFSLMEEYDINVDVFGGSVIGSGAAADVEQWRSWIGSHL